MDDSEQSAIPPLPLSLIDKKGKEKEETTPQGNDPKPKGTPSKVERRDVIDRKNKPPKMPLAIVDRDLSTLALHSPSSQIIGTPFALASTSTPFEYPFPETPPPSSSSSPFSFSLASVSASSSPPLYYNNHRSPPSSAFPLSLASSSSNVSSGPPRNQPLPFSFVHGPSSFSTNHHTHPIAHNTSASTCTTNTSRVNHHPHSKSHPKLLHTLGTYIHANAPTHAHVAPPPVPPSLVRKRAAASAAARAGGRWNVRLLGGGALNSRRRSVSGERHGDPAAAGDNEEGRNDYVESLQLGDDDDDDDDDDPGLDDPGTDGDDHGGMGLRCGTGVNGPCGRETGCSSSSSRRRGGQ